MKKRILSAFLTLALVLAALPLAGSAARAKTIPAGQTVGTVLFYITNRAGEEVLVSRIPVSEMEADMKAGKIDTTVHNYSLLDRFVTTLHQEAQGFLVPEFVAYAQGKSTVAALRSPAFTFAGKDVIRFWEIDQTGYDDLDTYTWDDLYGVKRYNFPLLYEYWNYRTQDYYDPAGVMTRDEVVNHIFAHGEEEVFLLSVRAFSQRFMITDAKYGAGDYNMENYWHDLGIMDNQRTMRVMKPMTEAELRGKIPTASDTRYWTANILLNMAEPPDVAALGTVAAPTAVMTEDGDNYYIRFSCATPGATILYNHNYISPSYTPTSPYGGTAVAVPKLHFPDGTVTMTCRAVKDGYTDKGVVTLKLTSGGTEKAWQNPFTDVKDTDWYYNAVKYVASNGLFDAVGSGTFGPERPMTRAMLVTALHRLAGSPSVAPGTVFTDVPAGAAYATAVAWAYENGVVSGTTPTTFAPDGSITREQIAAMLHRYAVFAGADTTAASDTAAFTDGGAISGWARAAMAWAVGAKLINGMPDGTVAPQGTATRAQVAQILFNLDK